MASEMPNRLQELRTTTNPRAESPDDDSGENDEQEIALEGFFSTVDDLSRSTNDIEAKLELISQAQNDIITQPASSNKAAKDRHAKLMEQVKLLSQKVHRGLKRLNEEIKADEKGPERHSAEFRIKKSQFSALSHKFKQVMFEYNALEEDYRQRSMDLIKRQLKTVDPRQDTSDEKVEELLEAQDLSVFTQDILVQSAHKREALNEVEERKKEILALEENILELHDMFYDMMLLVEEQGDLINNIENQVETAAVYVTKGKDNIKKAVVYSRKNRKIRWVICCVITTVLVVVLVAIGVIVAIAYGVTSSR